MSEIIRVTKFNDVHIKLHCDASVAYELNEYFTFSVPGARFTPAFKNKMWDGKIRLFHLMRQTLYVGLLDKVKQFATDRGYHVEYDKPNEFASTNFTLQDAQQHVTDIDLTLQPRDYQYEAFMHAVRKKRAVMISPTASGKSLIIYLLTTHLIGKKVLIIVPTTGLVHQMASDFEDYGCPPDLIHKIFSGQEKDTDAHITITTWQSIYQLPAKWFSKYGCVIGDEAHTFKAKCLVSIMEKLTTCEYRYGFTGTLDGTQTNKLVLEGLFGPVKVVTTTAELMEQKTVAQMNIKAIVLNYSDDARKLFANRKPKPTYKDELLYLLRNKERSQFIANLVSSLKNNTLLLFNNIDHGRMLQQLIQANKPDQEVFFVFGGVEGEEREEIRKYVEVNKNVVVVASYKTFATGTNIKNLHNVVFGSPSKSRVRVLQSIGRGLRTSNEKSEAVLYDVADDLSWKSYQNHTIKHFSERIQMYNQEKFDYKIFTVQLKESST
jgi:superfamily II DNA or RNA helicase